MFSQERNLAALEICQYVPTMKRTSSGSGPILLFSRGAVTAGTAGFHRLPPLSDWLPSGTGACGHVELSVLSCFDFVFSDQGPSNFTASHFTASLQS